MYNAGRECATARNFSTFFTLWGEQPFLSQRFLRVGRGREWWKDTNIDNEFKFLLLKLPLFYGLQYIRCLFLSIWTNLQCFLARPNSWTKSRQKLTQPRTVSTIQLVLYTLWRRKEEKLIENYIPFPQRNCTFMNSQFNVNAVFKISSLVMNIFFK